MHISSPDSGKCVGSAAYRQWDRTGRETVRRNEGAQVDQEAQLISVALVRYADSCPPTLHPDCPYAEESEGKRTCHSQCRDEVVRLSKPGHSGGTILAGPLFDARQCLLSERSTVPEANWHPSSLLQRFRSAVLYPPRDHRGDHLLVREIDATNALAYLGQLGFDIEWIARFGLTHELSTRLALWVIDWSSELDQDQERPGWLAPWLEAFEQHVGDEFDSSDIGQMLAAAHRSGFIGWIERWLQQAPLQDIIGWTPIAKVDEHQVPDDGQARWMIDRFTETYLRDWAETSLQHEYRYLRGRQDPPVPLAEMMRRQLSEADVDRELARRAVEGSRSRLVEVKSQAIALLGEGRRREATALFDAARILEPQDAEAHNNYGFCLTPDDPETALRALVRAEELGLATKALNLLNQAIALRLLGRTVDALTATERAHDQTGGRSEPAWLWTNLATSEEPTIENVDLLTYIRRLGRELAEEVGEKEQSELWRERLSQSEGATG
jgi:tetratricopeptide (TPR) repeat protein